ncbi:hypothetical protein SAMN06298216_0332 [Spirosomataceae bacterium TFI 002]|nr:hypothetical protein SAMN06298216_0332 [Spirosomataceae bacterium TFI 002]
MTSSKIKSLQTIHLAVAGSLLFFGAVVYYLLNYDGGAITDLSPDIFRRIVPITIILGMTAAYYFKKTMLRTALAQKNDESKWAAYQKAFMVELACLEIPGLVSIVAALLTGETNFLLIGIALIAVILFRRPTERKVRLELGV